jgi:exosortase A-associated hydrolase 2
MVAEQARWFARQGLSCTVLDFYGTGESPGDLTDATVAIWQQNIAETIQQLLARHPADIYLWGCRLGALIGFDFMQKNSDAIHKLLLWQPIPDGKTLVKQILRQRSAAQIQKGEKIQPGADRSGRPAPGDIIEVAGYRMGADLLASIEQLDMRAATHIPAMDIFWFEHSADDGADVGGRTMAVVEHLQQLSSGVALQLFAGEPVWQLHKRASCEALLAQTRELSL